MERAESKKIILLPRNSLNFQFWETVYSTYFVVLVNRNKKLVPTKYV